MKIKTHKISKITLFSHIDGSQIKKSAWRVSKMCREWYNLSFKQLKFDLELQYWLKIEKNRKFGDALLPLSRAKISKLKTFYGNGLHLRGRVLEILHLDAKTEPWILARSQNNAIWKSYVFNLKWIKNGWRWFLPAMVLI